MLVVALVLVLWVAVRVIPPDPEPVPSAPAPPGGPAFVVQVLKPRMNRPFAGLLPNGFLGLPPHAHSFDHASPGAEVVSAAPDRLALRADGWEFVLAIDAEGNPGPDTQVVYSLELSDRRRTLRIRPAADAAARLDVTPRPGTDVLDVRFHVEFRLCEDAETGRPLEWPGKPLIVRGSFEGRPNPDPR